MANGFSDMPVAIKHYTAKLCWDILQLNVGRRAEANLQGPQSGQGVECEPWLSETRLRTLQHRQESQIIPTKSCIGAPGHCQLWSMALRPFCKGFTHSQRSARHQGPRVSAALQWHCSLQPEQQS